MKRAIRFILFSIIALPVFAYGQAPDILWMKNYGYAADDQAWQVRETQDGGFIMVGMADVGNPTDLDVYLIKTDGNGDTIWTQTYDYATLIDVGQSILPLDDDGYLVTGYRSDLNDGQDLLLFKVDSSGEREWFNIIYGASGRSIKQTADDGFVIAGYAFGDTVDDDMYVARIDSSWNQLWTATYGGPSGERAWDICQTPDGGFFVVGWTESYESEGSDIFVVKADPNGNIVWWRNYGTPGNDEGRNA